MCFFLKQLKASGSFCRHSIGRALAPAWLSRCGVRAHWAGAGWAGRAVCIQQPSIVLQLFESSPRTKEGVRVGLGFNPAVTAFREEKPLPPAEQA